MGASNILSNVKHDPTLESEDQDWFGDKIDMHDGWNTGENIKTMRVGVININGLSCSMKWLEWELLLRNSYSLQIDALGIVEPDVNFNNTSTLYQLKEIAKKKDRSIQLSTSCSNQLNATRKKKGGTMTVLAGRWAGRKKDIYGDSKGRWNSITLMGS
jgi:hypothetical protein